MASVRRGAVVDAELPKRAVDLELVRHERRGELLQVELVAAGKIAGRMRDEAA